MRISLMTICLFGLVCLVSPSARVRSDEKKADKRPKALAAEFVYPEAEKLTDPANPVREGGGIYHARYTTPDRPAKVVAWYKKQIKFIGVQGIGFARLQEEGEARAVHDDSWQPSKTEGGRGEPRSVTLWVLVKKTKDHHVTAVVSRTKDETLTHIALTWMAADQK
jgi:hypothetical protein